MGWITVDTWLKNYQVTNSWKRIQIQIERVHSRWPGGFRFVYQLSWFMRTRVDTLQNIFIIDTFFFFFFLKLFLSLILHLTKFSPFTSHNIPPSIFLWLHNKPGFLFFLNGIGFRGKKSSIWTQGIITFIIASHWITNHINVS